MSRADLFRRLTDHFHGDPARLPVVQQIFELYERPNLHLAIEEAFRDSDCQSELLGLIEFDYETSLARLSRQSSAQEFDEGPVEYADVAVGNDKTLACVKNGL